MKPEATRLIKHIGCSGWFYWHWKGAFYPAELPTHRWFKHYLANFSTVELNAPFYRWPLPSTVKGWARQASPRFKYAIKVNRLITHEKRFEGTEEDIQNFCQLVGSIGTKLGCFLFQLPPSYKFSSANLHRIVRQLPSDYKHAVEFRHKSWWNEETYAAFRERGIMFCSVSGPRLPTDCIRTAEDVYMRFHGKDRWYRYDYSAAELREWAARLADSGARHLWCYFNNDREGHAIRNAHTLERLLQPANLKRAA